MGFFNSKKSAAVMAIAMVFVSAQGIFAQDGKRIYAGVRLGGSANISSLKDEEMKKYLDADKDYEWLGTAGSFDVAPFISLQLADKFALQTEVMITKFHYGGEKGEGTRGGGEYAVEGVYQYENKYSFSRKALVIPILAKLTIRANDKVSFGLFAGPHITANIGKWEEYEYEKETEGGETYEYESIYFYSDDDYKDWIKVPSVGFTIGAYIGFMTKIGTFFADIRFLSDIGNVKMKDYDYNYYTGRETERWVDYVHRAKLNFSLGYEFGAGSR
jgi:hypothetical protein